MSQNYVDNVKVCVRVKPIQSGESKRCISAIPAQNSILIAGKPESKVFSYDMVADETVSQQSLYQSIARPLVESFVNGYNTCIFAYGQTASGKSYTIQGEGVNSDQLQPHHGLIPRVFQSLFTENGGLLNNLTTYKCTLSFLEIYNEHIIDLLEKPTNIQHPLPIGGTQGTSSNLNIRDDNTKGIYVEGLKEVEVKSTKVAMGLLMTGMHHRHVASTQLNLNSSRSHSVLSLHLESRVKDEKTGGSKSKYSRFNIIDLAGSERQKSTDSVGGRLREAGNINKSLTVLGTVIRALVDLSKGKPRHIPYRDSKLSFLLKDSLGGNSKTYLIATVSPEDISYTETLSTLQFAHRVKNVKNIAIINEESLANIGNLKDEILKLRQDITRLATSSSASNNTIISTGTSSTIGGISSNSNRPYQERIYDLEVLLSNSLEREESLNSLTENYLSKNKALKILCDKKQHFISSLKLVLKLRESHIARLQNASNKQSTTTKTTYEQDLLEEIQILKLQIQSHPEISRLAIENLNLKELVSQYESMFRDGKDFYEDQITGLRQQITELVTEVNTLLKQKLSQPYQVNNINSNNSNNILTPSIMKTPNKLVQDNIIENSPISPYILKEKFRTEMEKLREVWDNEKKTMELDHQLLYQKYVQLESESKSLINNYHEQQKQIELVKDNYQNEIVKYKDNVETLMEILTKTNSQTLTSGETIAELNKTIVALEEQIVQSNQSKLQLIRELDDKNHYITKLKILLESTQISNQRLSEIFISTPKDVLNQSVINDNSPIKFELDLNEHSTISSSGINNHSSNNNNNSVDLLDLQEILESKNDLILDLEERIEILNSTIQNLQPTSTVGITNTVDVNTEVIGQQSKRIQDLENELTLLKQSEQVRMDRETELNNVIRDLYGKLEIQNQLLVKRDTEIQSQESRYQLELLNLKTTISSDIDNSYKSITDEIESNLTSHSNLLIGELSQQNTDHQELVNKYTNLKQQYHKLDKTHTNSVEDYQSRMSELYFELSLKSTEIENLQEKVKYLQSQKQVEPDYIVISSDEEDIDYSKINKSNYHDESDDFDYTNITIKQEKI
ncbi:kinesin-3 [Tieghemostelium lacteum]|uniref:Kinesin-3 n=1 Tax=Tieghemostelium lacteum TaxID=361077 RepID=A0A151ZC95_TIELA|nr:kinesin-3 [Tieghemostelium lacteum]|eukprot:KYQ91573.1 kinesin-3 [Tieghemostelium lacteum]